MRKSKLTRKLELRQSELLESIAITKQLRRQMLSYYHSAEKAFHKGEISLEKYAKAQYKILQGKTLDQWVHYYDTSIKALHDEYDAIRFELKSRVRPMAHIILAIVLVTLTGLGLVFGPEVLNEGLHIQESLLGFTVDDSTVEDSSPEPESSDSSESDSSPPPEPGPPEDAGSDTQEAASDSSDSDPAPEESSGSNEASTEEIGTTEEVVADLGIVEQEFVAVDEESGEPVATTNPLPPEPTPEEESSQEEQSSEENSSTEPVQEPTQEQTNETQEPATEPVQQPEENNNGGSSPPVENTTESNQTNETQEPTFLPDIIFDNNTVDIDPTPAPPQDNTTQQNTTAENETQEPIVVQETTTEELLQYPAVIGEPVRWTKHIRLPSVAPTLYITLDGDATNITVNKVVDAGPGTSSLEYIDITPSVLIEQEAVTLSFFGGIFEFITSIFQSITGLAVAEENLDSEFVIVVREPVQEILVEYYTEAPALTEESTSFGKRVTVSAEEHYKNIKTFVTIPNTPQDAIKLYWLVNGTRQSFSFTTDDKDNDSLVDYVEWITPHTSNETFELELTVLNVQSYPFVGGNWTVAFNTTGTAYLNITAYNGTSWSNDSETEDLKFLHVACGDSIVDYEWQNGSVFIANYTCNNETSTEVSKVLTTGKHTIEFNFGGIKKYAYNQAFNCLGNPDGVLDVSSDTTINGTMVCSNITVRNNAKLIVDSLGGNDTVVNITAENIDVQAGSQITADATGFPGGQGPGVGTSGTDSGGSYGGRGGFTANEGYGSITHPLDLGSGGQDGNADSGGGAMFLNVSNNLTVNGVITANGTTTAVGGASGGSVYIWAANITGTGRITASGGRATSAGDGGGGGGRIAIYYTTNQFTGDIEALGGLATTSFRSGGSGTIYIRNVSESLGDVIIQNGDVGVAGTTPINATFLPENIGNLIIANYSTLDHANSTNFGDFTFANVTVKRNASIDVTQRGFRSNTGPGRGVGNDAGGAHGGRGGFSSNTVYGSITAPTTRGSGGQDPSSGTGGGATFFNITDTLIVNGSIHSNGTSGNGASAGGSVYFITSDFRGKGLIEANGGRANAGSDGGGGGGRIAIYYTSKSFSGNISARGGVAATDTFTGGAGTIFQKADAQTYGDLIVSNDNYNPAVDTPINTSYLSTAIDNFIIANASEVSHGNTTDLSGLSFANVTIKSNASINLVGLGFRQGTGPGRGTVSDAGAAHGGEGGLTAPGVYGNAIAPTEFGSGSEDSAIGGDGGGATFLNASDTITVDGKIAANGSAASSGGGAGGSIYIITNNLHGTGAITASGGPTVNANDGAGGGGRIAIYYTLFNFTGSLAATGQNGSTSNSQGGAGTIFLKSSAQTHGDLLIHNEFREADKTPINESFVPLNFIDNLIVDNGSLVDFGNSTAFRNTTFGNVTVGTTGKIDVSNRGFRANTGPGRSTANDGGGTYGGTGGSPGTATPYGNLTNPLDRGSGGQDGNSGTAGGVAFLNVSNTLTIEGEVMANGSTTSVGGGSAGSIFLIAKHLTGSGKIFAFGGRAISGSDGGGGGGRIAIYSQNNTFSGDVAIRGGNAVSANLIGQPGSLFECRYHSDFHCRPGKFGSDVEVLNGSTILYTAYDRNISLNITRNITILGSTRITWTDNSSNSSTNGTYTALGLTPNQNFDIFDNGVFQVRLASNDSGSLANFNISLSSLHNISIEQALPAPPAISSTLLNATSRFNRTIDNLTVNATASDQDSDGIKFLYNFLRNSTTITLLNMPFERINNTGINNTQDYSTLNNHATFSNATWNSTGGYDINGSSYSFDPTNNQAIFTELNLDQSSSSEGVTMMAWVLPNSTSSGNHFVISTELSTGSPWGIFRDGNNWEVATGTSDQDTGLDVDANQWQHVAAVFDPANSEVRFYKNSVEATVAEIGFTATDTNVTIGARRGITQEWDGNIDEVVIYNRTLSSEQVRAIFENRTNELVANETKISEVWTVVITPNDGSSGDGTSVTTNEVEIEPYFPNCDNVSGSLVVDSSDTITANVECFNLTITNGAVLTIDSNAAGNIGLTVAAEFINVEAGARISADGTGFPGSQGPAPGSPNNAGGSHGGDGGFTTRDGGYGDIRKPVTLGSGGEDGGGGAGGGAVFINASRKLIVNGNIVANGSDDNEGGGAGGSVYIHTSSLEGSGSITASGGAGVSGAGGGGGGRVAIYYTSNSYTGAIESFGGISSDPDNSGAPGTVFIKNLSKTDGDLVIQNNNVFTNSLTIVNESNLQGHVETFLLVNSSRLGFGDHIGGFINISYTNVTIDSNSSIQVSGKGFAAQAGPGAGVGSGPSAGGGSYGGQAGGSGIKTPYGNITDAVDRGSGGSSAAGGGAAFINVTDTFVMDGVIRANGSSSTSGGGSGGSIYIRSGSLHGSGNITARGGRAIAGSFEDGGGGGGRIAIYYDTYNFTGKISVRGGRGLVAEEGGPGTIYLKGNAQAHGDLIINNDLQESGTTPLNNSYIPAVLDNIFIVNGSIVDHGNVSGFVNFSSRNFTLDTSSSIDVLGRGYPGGSGPGVGINTDAGGSYGGKGGGVGNTVYGNVTHAIDWGSGGTSAAADGAGTVYLNVSDNLTIDGQILANGTTTDNDGAGAGGGIFISTKYFSGTGTILAQGGSSLSDGSASSGGGGRISIYYEVDNFVGRIAAGTGTATGTLVGGAGTIFLKSSNQSWGDVIVNADLRRSTETPLNDTFLPSMIDNLFIVNGSVVNHGQTIGGRFNFSSRNISIDINSTLDVSEDGFSGGNGPGVGTGTTDSGGSFGGRGGSSTNTVYGNASFPIDRGSGGQNSNVDGGGTTYLNVSDSLTVNGIIRANGSTSNNGGGSGGSILISTGTLQGSGLISAQGGRAISGAGNDGGGGGGRIALYYSSYNFTGNITAQGGASFDSDEYGGAGTVFMKDSAQTFGDLIINSHWSPSGETPINDSYLFTDIDNFFIVNGSNVNHANSTGIRNRVFANITIKNATLELTGIGFGTGDGPGAGVNVDDGAMHGGFGGNPSSTARIYGNLTGPLDWGSGGSGSAGGASTLLNVTNTLTIDGNITANGSSSTGGGGSGSGGSIFLIADTITGMGNILAMGGRVGFTGDGGGGGGRLAMYYNTNTFTGTINLSGGIAPNSRTGQHGSIFMCDSQKGFVCSPAGGSSLFSSNGTVNVTTTYSINTTNNVTRYHDFTWTQSNFNWTDVASNSTTNATYTVSGLAANKNYIIYDNGVNIASLTTDGNGKLPDFTITLSSQHNLSGGSDNNAPSINTVLLNATTRFNTTFDNLTANVTTADNDSDPVRVIHSFRLNSTPIASLIMPFEKANQSTGNNTKDYSGFNNHGVEGGNIVWNATSGWNNTGSYLFNGNSSHIIIPDSNFESITEVPFTAIAWAKRFNSSLRHPILSQGSGSGTGREWISFDNASDICGEGKISTDIGNANLCSSTTTTVNRHFHIALTYDGSDLKLYINGAEENSTSITADENANGNFTIGTNTQLNEFMNGSIDEVRIFNRSLSSSQILAWYENRSNELVNNETNKFENWSVVVTPNDGNQDGTSAISNNVVIGNYQPNITELILNATSISNGSADNLTAYSSTFDLDAENIKVIYNWFHNDTSITVLNMPFERTNNTNLNNTRDYSGYNNHGDEIGSVAWNSTGGHDEKGAFDFDGSGRINVPDSNFERITQASFSATAWVRKNTTTGTKTILSQIGGAGTGRTWLAVDDSGVCGDDTLASDIGNANLCGGSISTNIMTHVGVTYNGTVLRIYVDGVELNSSSVTADESADGNFTIGADPSLGDFMRGAIDDVMIFNRSLSNAQMLALAQNRTDEIVSNETKKDETWKVVGVANDEWEDGSPVTSLTLTVRNTLPEVTEVILNATTIGNKTSDNLTGFATSQDREGESVKNIYNFNLNGTSITLLNMPFEKINDTDLNNTQDYSTFNNHGTFSNATWNATGGFDGKGTYSFDGNDMVIYTPLNLDQTSSGPGATMMAWVLPNSTSTGSHFVFSTRDDSGGIQWGMRRQGNNWFVDSGTSGQDTSFGVDANEWQHIAAVFDPDNTHIRFYKNGVESIINELGFSSADHNITIGGRGDIAFLWDGNIDEVVVYNRSLTKDQVYAIFQNRTTEIVSNETKQNENWTLTVWPNDGSEDGIGVTSPPIKILGNFTSCPNSEGNLTITVDTTIASSIECNVITVTNNSVFTLDSTGAGNVSINVTANILNITKGAKISASGTGFFPGFGPGVGIANDDGGSYGGLSGRETGNTYGSITFPTDLGSGSEIIGSGIAKGGGAIVIRITNFTIVNGSIEANGTGSVAAGGSGGSILIMTDELLGNGVIAAHGGSAIRTGDGAGGGGRIAVYYDTYRFNGSISTIGGNANDTDKTGGAGTIFLQPSNGLAELIVSNDANFTDPRETIINTTFLDIFNFSRVSVLNRSIAAIGRNINTSVLVVENNGTLTHQRNNDTQVYTINITAVNVTVTSDSRIDVSGKGFDSGQGPGSPSTTDAGGAHGGDGGLGGNDEVGGRGYGNAVAPQTIGSSGQDFSSGLGGGAIALNVTGTLQLDGVIDANGTATTRGGGAGGSIYLITDIFTGSGTISANGGNSSTVNDGAGGGGRVAIYTNTNTFTGPITVFGGLGTDVEDSGAAGTLFIKASSDPFGILDIRNNPLVNAEPETLLNTTTLPIFNLSNLSISTNARVALDRPLNLSTVHITDSSVLTHTNNSDTQLNFINLTVVNFTLDSDSLIDLTGRGFAPGRGPGTSPNSGAGGAYGGDGGPGSGANNPGGDTYGNALTPTDLGSGNNDTAAGAGGGLLNLNITGFIVVDGDILVNGTTSTRGGGSGGTVYIKTPNFTGSGTIAAAGGRDIDTADGGGGGGRISIEYGSRDYSGTFDVQGGLSGGNRAGAAGTVYLKDRNQQFGDLIINSDRDIAYRFVGSSGLPIPLTRINATFVPTTNFNTFNVTDGPVVVLGYGINTSLVNVVRNSTLSHFRNNQSETFKLNITAVNITIDSTSELRVTGLGFAGEFGPGAGVGGDDGGSHGGKGAPASGFTYGSAIAPINIGSGSERNNGYGGGAILLNATDRLVLDGKLIANGSTSSQGGGAGGSIYLIGSTVSGSGTISANGGRGTGTGDGGGGGGRIAVYYDTNLFAGSFEARGGTAVSDQSDGGAGTIFVKSQLEDYGSLTIGGNSSYGTKSLTPINRYNATSYQSKFASYREWFYR